MLITHTSHLATSYVTQGLLSLMIFSETTILPTMPLELQHPAEACTLGCESGSLMIKSPPARVKRARSRSMLFVEGVHVACTLSISCATRRPACTTAARFPCKPHRHRLWEVRRHLPPSWEAPRRDRGPAQEPSCRRRPLTCGGCALSPATSGPQRSCRQSR